MENDGEVYKQRVLHTNTLQNANLVNLGVGEIRRWLVRELSPARGR